MPSPPLINLGGRPVVKVQGFGYMTLPDYQAPLVIQKINWTEYSCDGCRTEFLDRDEFKIHMGDCSGEQIACGGCDEFHPLKGGFCEDCTSRMNCSRISNRSPETLSAAEVLEVCLLYLKKYLAIGPVADIIIGTRYEPYMEYVYKRLRGHFPEATFRLLSRSENQFVVRASRS
jgi:hypothetical protein